MGYWALPRGSVLLDNFVGSGTTLVAAKRLQLSAIGYDLSPLAVTVSAAKTAHYELDSLHTSRIRLENYEEDDFPSSAPSNRLIKAFSPDELGELGRVLKAVAGLPDPDRRFFLVAALSTAYHFTRAVSDGGWLRWIEKPDRGAEVRQFFERRVEQMLKDIKTSTPDFHSVPTMACLADARELPQAASSVDAVLTSPPYPNRHDYSRVFHIGLLLIGESEPDIMELRKRSFRSHVEAKASEAWHKRLLGFQIPPVLGQVLEFLHFHAEPRIEQMIRGYFEDIFLSLQEVVRVLRPGGRAAFVIGNVRHSGQMIPVDEVLTHLATQVGLELDTAWVLRVRGNSAQQMGRYGKEPSRESVVLFSKM